ILSVGLQQEFRFLEVVRRMDKLRHAVAVVLYSEFSGTGSGKVPPNRKQNKVPVFPTRCSPSVGTSISGRRILPSAMPSELRWVAPEITSVGGAVGGSVPPLTQQLKRTQVAAR